MGHLPAIYHMGINSFSATQSHRGMHMVSWENYYYFFSRSTTTWCPGDLLRRTLVYMDSATECVARSHTATECVARSHTNLRWRRPLEDHVTGIQKHWRITRFVVTPWSPAFSKRANFISLPFSFCGPVETVRSTRTITPVLYGPVVLVFDQNTPTEQCLVLIFMVSFGTTRHLEQFTHTWTNSETLKVMLPTVFDASPSKPLLKPTFWVDSLSLFGNPSQVWFKCWTTMRLLTFKFDHHTIFVIVINFEFFFFL